MGGAEEANEKTPQAFVKGTSTVASAHWGVDDYVIINNTDD